VAGIVDLKVWDEDPSPDKVWLAEGSNNDVSSTAREAEIIPAETLV